MIRTLTLVSLFATTSIYVAAQPKAKFQQTQFDLGNIAWHSKSEAAIKLTNTGNKPLQITDVHPDCECTVVSYDRNEVAPGKSTTIVTTFDAETLGHFSRLISIKTNADADATDILLAGHVLPMEVDHTAEFSYHIENVHLSTDVIEFNDVNKGDNPEVVVTVYNSDKNDYTPSFLHLPKWLSAVASPEVLKPGRIGHVAFTLNSDELTELGVNQATIYVARHSGDKIRKEAAMNVSATLLPNLDDLQGAENEVDENSRKVAKTSAAIEKTSAAIVENISEEEMAVEAVPEADIPVVLCLGTSLGKKKQKGKLYLENKGTATLHVTTLQVYNPGIEVSLSKSAIEPGDKAILKVTALPKLSKFKGRPRILMITDDPKHTKIEIDLIAQ